MTESVQDDVSTVEGGSFGGDRSASATGQREIGNWSFGGDRWKLELGEFSHQVTYFVLY